MIWTILDIHINYGPRSGSQEDASHKQNNCCTFTEAILVKAWLNRYSDFSWSNAKHARFMIQLDTITNGNDRMKCLNDLLDDNIGELFQKIESDGTKINDELKPVPWLLVQGFTKEHNATGNSWALGHSFIIVDYDKKSDRVLILESNSSYGLDGPGFRKLGDIDFYKPSYDWVEESVLTYLE